VFSSSRHCALTDIMTTPAIRFAQFNASLNRNNDGDLVRDLATPNNAQAKATAEIIQRVNADVILINEFDYFVSEPLSAVNSLRRNYLEVSQNGAGAVTYPYAYIAPSNTGIASGFDLNNNGQTVTMPGTAGYGDDALGFGNFPGQFGMLLLSKYPIDTKNVRTFQNFLWKDMPGNLLTNDPTIDNPATAVNENLGGFYSKEEQNILRLSSKSHWDVPIIVDGEVIHALVSHPTPPVFDGTEDRNGKRNYDEIRFWSDYVLPGKSGYIYDDAGRKGGIAPGTKFVIMGDQNADPNDGDSYNAAVRQLLQNPVINTNFIPTSLGATQQAALQQGANASQKSNPAFDTADFADTTPGNLRTDYVLPSNNLQVTNAGVFWPLNSDPKFNLVGTFNASLPGGFPSSDHRAVFTDINLTPSSAKNINNATFLGQTTFPTATTQTLNGISTQIGGLSGITYDAANNRYYIISDDRGDRTPANSTAAPPPAANIPPRFYTAQIDPTNLANGGVTFTGVTLLKDANDKTFAPFALDPEGIALTNKGTVFISSEGEANITAGRVTNPLIGEFDLATGKQIRALTIPQKFLPIVEDTNKSGKVDTGDTQKSGIRNNLAFESLTITPNQQFLYTANEGALLQDGNVTTLTTGSPVRIVQYNLVTGQPEKEYLYNTDKIAQAANPSTGFQDNGLVDLLAIDDRGTLLALERSFAQGVGNTIKVYEVTLPGATDISFYDSLTALSTTQLAAIKPAEKRLILNLNDLKLPNGTDNIEGISFGPKLADGRQSLILTSDNNFSATQFTQIIGLAVQPSDRPSLTTYDWNNRPVIGQTGGQDIFLGGFSGLFYQGLASNSGNLKFITLTDRGPNGTDQAGKRPFALPAFQPEIINFELNPQTGTIAITQRIKLTDSSGKPITGLPNLQAGATGLAYTDEIPIDTTGKTLTNDALGADVEGVVVAPNGDYWLVDEYRPAIYQFNNQGKLLNRFVPAGTAVAVGKPLGTFGTEALPAVYAQRRSNRGFEAIALEGNKLYAFIQSAIDNPDSTGDTTSRNSRNLRILEFDVTTSKVTGEYLYLLDDITGSGNARTDKLGDAVSLGNGKFALVERDDRSGVDANKLIYQIDLKGVTNINNAATLKLPVGKTIEQLSPTELTAAGITPVSKRLITNVAQAGYTGVEKLEGLALIDANTLAIINDNDFGITDTVYNADGSVKITVGNTPVKLGLLELSTPLNIDISALVNRGENTLYGQNTANTIAAIFGDNTIYAGEGGKSIQTGSGNDRIYTGSGDDLIQAGSGNNLIYAGEGANRIFSEIGDDTIYTGSGNDTIFAGLGQNLIYAGEGNNTITSTGIDTIYTGSGQDRFLLDRGAGEATIIGFNTNDRITLGGTLKFQDLTLRQSGFDTVLSVGTDTLATLKWTNVNTVTSSLFVA
jgi:hypothetical protein